MAIKTVPTQIVGYYRVSTEGQGIRGLGMAAQREAVEGYARSSGLSIAAVYEEVETGRKQDLNNRPQLLAALGHARRCGATLVIARLDRLARSVFVTAQLMNSGVEFVVCDNPHANRLTIHILAAMAEYEGRLIAERTKAGLAAAKARGIKLGNPRDFTPEERVRSAIAAAASHKRRAREAYADLVPIVRELRTAGETMNGVARALNVLGHTNQRGLPWSGVTIRYFLKREEMSTELPLTFRQGFQNKEHQNRAIAESTAWKKTIYRETYAPTVARILERYRCGASIRAIAAELEANSIPKLGKGPWTASIVRDIIRREGHFQPYKERDGNPRPQIQRAAILAAVAARHTSALAHRAKMIPKLEELRERGLTFAAIAKEMNRRRLRTFKGLLWNGAAVWITLYRPLKT